MMWVEENSLEWKTIEIQKMDSQNSSSMTETEVWQEAGSGSPTDHGHL